MNKERRVLIASCNKGDAGRFRKALFDLDCRIRVVAEGADCLDQLQRFQPHLVLLDTAITDPDAFELCRRIKNDHVAMVVIATELNELGEIDRAVNAGTDDFVSKPVNETELRRRVDCMLQFSRYRPR